MGPTGRNVIIDKSFGNPVVTKNTSTNERRRMCLKQSMLSDGTETYQIQLTGVYDGQNVVIANNLFLNNAGGVVEFRAGSGPLERSEDVSFVNNLVVDTRGRMPTVRKPRRL